MRKETTHKWNRRYFGLARRISYWSKDPKAKVGAVLLDRRGWPIALGYNGFPARVEDDINKLEDSKLKNQMIVHAEQNALLCAGSGARSGTLYVYGKPVCPRCAVLIIQAGVKRVLGIRPDPIANPTSDTHKSGRISLTMFEEAGVEFVPLDPEILKTQKKQEKPDQNRKTRTTRT
ncbi:MAG: deoxycytidylate deaminase [Terriglobia bacterium]